MSMPNEELGPQYSDVRWLRAELEKTRAERDAAYALLRDLRDKYGHWLGHEECARIDEVLGGRP